MPKPKTQRLGNRTLTKFADFGNAHTDLAGKSKHRVIDFSRRDDLLRGRENPPSFGRCKHVVSGRSWLAPEQIFQLCLVQNLHTQFHRLIILRTWVGTGNNVVRFLRHAGAHPSALGFNQLTSFVPTHSG